jgi:carboxymethylenebutenolidase
MDLVEIETADGTAEALVVIPEGAEPEGGWPGVLMGMDAIGIRPRLAEMAREIASWGYVVVVPNAFYRTKTVAEVAPAEPLMTPEARGAFFQRIGPSLSGLTSEQVERDLDAWLGYLRTHEHVAEPPYGFVGFCFGVRVGCRAAGRFPDEIAAVAGFHGGQVVTEAPDSPHLSIPGATARFVLLHADHDAGMTPADVAVLDDTFASAGLQAVNEIVPGVAHGYTMADTAVYDEAATRRALRETRALFAETLRSRLTGPEAEL